MFGQGARPGSGRARSPADDQEGSSGVGEAFGCLVHGPGGGRPDGHGQRADQVDVLLVVEQVERHLQVHGRGRPSRMVTNA